MKNLIKNMVSKKHPQIMIMRKCNEKEKKMLISQCKKWLFANLRRRLWNL